MEFWPKLFELLIDFHNLSPIIGRLEFLLYKYHILSEFIVDGFQRLKEGWREGEKEGENDEWQDLVHMYIMPHKNCTFMYESNRKLNLLLR